MTPLQLAILQQHVGQIMAALMWAIALGIVMGHAILWLARALNYLLGRFANGFSSHDDDDDYDVEDGRRRRDEMRAEYRRGWSVGFEAGRHPDTPDSES